MYGTPITNIKYNNNDDNNEESIIINKNIYIPNDTQKLFIKYFDNPIMTKISNPKATEHSYYYAKVNVKLLNQYRYVIAITTKDEYNIGKRTYMNNLNWVTLQMRTLKTNKNIQTFLYNNKNLLNDITLYKNKDHTHYSEYNNKNFGIKVFIFFTKNKLFYPNKMSLSNAIETYQTIINLK
tara:strand:+ start:1560 stop:2102 length:543 start_codon:yes stop_codon:yes gene_type:complete